MRGFNSACPHFRIISSLNAINQRAINCGVNIEMMAKASINKRIDDIGKSKKRFEVELLDQKRKNILCAHPLKSSMRTVPVLK